MGTRKNEANTIMVMSDYEAVYDCTAAEHSECDSNYCDFAYAQLVEDESGIGHGDDLLVEEFRFDYSEEREYDE